MKFFIKIYNSTFTISNSLANAIRKNNINFQLDIKNGSTVFIFESYPYFFKFIETISLTHFYITFLSKRYRVNKEFYTFLKSQPTKDNSVTTKQHYGNFDKFYTKPSVAQLCVSAFVSNIEIKKQDLIIEPSAGNGSFIQSLKAIDCDKNFIDIMPENNQIQKINFLK